MLHSVRNRFAASLYVWTGWRGGLDSRVPIVTGATEGAAGWSRVAVWDSQSL